MPHSTNNHKLVQEQAANRRSRLGYSLTHSGRQGPPQTSYSSSHPGLSKSSPRLLPLSSISPRNKQASRLNLSE